LPALNAEIGAPIWHNIGNVAFLISAGTGREGAIRWHQTDGDLVALTGEYARGNIPDEGRRIGRDERREFGGAGYAGRHRNIVQIKESSVNRREILVNDGLSPAAVGLANGFLDLVDGLVAREYAGNSKEAGLQHGVRARAEANLFGHGRGVDEEQPQLFVDNAALDWPG